MSRLPLKTVWPPSFSSSASKKLSISPYYFRPGTFLSFIKRGNVDHSESSVAIVLDNNVFLDFITFTVPKEVKNEVISLFNNLRITLKRRQKMNYLRGNQTLKDCYFPNKA